MIKSKKKKRQIFYAWWNKARRYSYRAAFEKIMFTMIGLWLALALNTWNDSMKRKNDEELILVQLEAALKQDLRDIEETISGYQYRMDGSTIVLKNLQAGGTVTDTLRAAIQSLNGYSFLSVNKGAYETLKSRGLNLIRNDTLRLDIATLYEVKYLNTERSESFFQKMYTDQTLPYIFTHFEGSVQGLSPLNWEKTRTDNFFRQLVNGSHYNNVSLLGRYQELQQVVTSLVRDIQQEIDRL